MVHSLCCVACLLGGDSVEPGGDPAEPGGAAASVATAPAAGPPRIRVDVERPLDRDSVREWYVDLAQRTSKRRRLPAGEAVPELVALHEVLGDVQGISAERKQRMRAVLRGRMEWYAHRLRRELAEAGRSVTGTRATGTGIEARRTGAASNPGPEALGAAGLIDLIQKIVNPPIWDVNGGPAGIGYFSPLQALVVRAPGEVHYQLGGTFEQVRRAAR